MLSLLPWNRDIPGNEVNIMAADVDGSLCRQAIDNHGFDYAI